MTKLEKLIKQIVDFRDARDWKQFHNPKDVAISLSLEAGEVLEHFQWKSKEEMQEHINSHKEDIGDELADVLYWVLLLSNDLEIDVLNALNKKMQKNAEKYPIEKAKGKHTKYNKL
ncbi:MAG TPA: nucleotide pyrophosphohydrolase [Candidatus Levybacteria bacterium]|nr:nucleotide pyrophosphohydrolase [Candidatus Levybacteria bacterium]